MLIRIYLKEGNATEALRQYDWYRRLMRSDPHGFGSELGLLRGLDPLAG